MLARAVYGACRVYAYMQRGSPDPLNWKSSNSSSPCELGV